MGVFLFTNWIETSFSFLTKAVQWKEKNEQLKISIQRIKQHNLWYIVICHFLINFICGYMKREWTNTSDNTNIADSKYRLHCILPRRLYQKRGHSTFIQQLTQIPRVICISLFVFFHNLFNLSPTVTSCWQSHTILDKPKCAYCKF